MSWLKLDDGFTKHPKFSGWTVAQKWAWLEVMEYCARYQTAGVIPDDLNIMPRSTTQGLLHRAETAGWIDRSDSGSRVIHDWPIYNSATVGEKVAYYLGLHPDATANDVHKAVGGTRELVLAEVTKQRVGGSEGGSAVPVSEPETEPPPNRFGRTSFAGSETGTHAREPVPSRPKDQNLPTTNVVELPTTTEEGGRSKQEEDQPHDLAALTSRAEPKSLPF